jgi:hypothetical protein
VLDSSKSGLGIVKPITRALRGGALLPYWIVTGLTAGSRIAQGLALTAGTLGVAMLVLAMFTLLPAWAIAPAVTAGAGLVLTMFGYAALRSGTMLHGLVLLTPVVPLAAYAAYRWRHPAPSANPAQTASEAATAVVSLGGVVAAAVALILLGSLPAVRKTPFAVAKDRWPVIVSLVVVGLVVWFAVRFKVWTRLPDLSEVHTAWLVLASGAAVSFAGTFAYLEGWRLKLWCRSSDQNWVRRRAVHPAAVIAGWAAVYGVVFLGLGWLLSYYSFPHALDPNEWMTNATKVAALSFAAILLLVVPWLVPWRARMKIHRQLVAEAGEATYGDGKDVQGRLLRRLGTHGLLCNYLVRLQTKEDKVQLVLRSAGQSIADEIRTQLASQSTTSGLSAQCQCGRCAGSPFGTW